MRAKRGGGCLQYYVLPLLSQLLSHVMFKGGRAATSFPTCHAKKWHPNLSLAKDEERKRRPIFHLTS